MIIIPSKTKPGQQPKPWRLSVSQLQTAKLCPRKWWFKYVGGLPEPERKGAAFGTTLHTQVEGYLRKGVLPPPAGRPERLLRVAVDQGLLPEPSSFGENLDEEGNLYRVEVEQRFVRDFLGEPFVGSIDLLQFWWDAGQKRIRVTDHKSMKDRKWAKTEEELRHDLQTGLYLLAAADLLEVSPQDTSLEVEHIGYLSEGPLEVFRTGPVAVSYQTVRETVDALTESVVKALVRSRPGGERMQVRARLGTMDPNVNARQLLAAFARAGLTAAGLEPREIETGGGADAHSFNERGLQCLNLSSGMEAIHTPDERIKVQHVEDLSRITVELVRAAAAA